MFIDAVDLERHAITKDEFRDLIMHMAAADLQSRRAEHAQQQARAGGVGPGGTRLRRCTVGGALRRLAVEQQGRGRAAAPAAEGVPASCSLLPRPVPLRCGRRAGGNGWCCCPG